MVSQKMIEKKMDVLDKTSRILAVHTINIKIFISFYNNATYE